MKKKNRFVTFITLGISDDKWIDIVAGDHANWRKFIV